MRQGQLHFITRLADAGKNDLVGRAASRQHAQQFSARNDIETRSKLTQQVQHRQIGIRLNRVTYQRAISVASCRFAGVGIGRKILYQCGLGLDVSRRAEFFGNSGKRRGFGAQDAVLIGKMRHVKARIIWKQGWSRYRLRMRRATVQGL